MKKYFLSSSERDALLSLLADVLTSNVIKPVELGDTKKNFL